MTLISNFVFRKHLAGRSISTKGCNLEEYLVSVEFTLPTDTNAGSLYFQNLSEYFMVGKLVAYLGLPALSDVPVLGSILDIYTQVQK